MDRNRNHQTFSLWWALRKLFVSAFVVFTFIAYAIHQRFTKPDSMLGTALTNSSIAAAQVLASSIAAPTSSALPPTALPPPPTAQPSATKSQAAYRDGTYTGAQVDAYYGLVEVQVTIQNGKMADVQFLQYPNDRRTSVQINAIAMPYLKQEALQVQSAHVNIISGATFTSEGFAMSLNAALNQAKN